MRLKLVGVFLIIISKTLPQHWTWEWPKNGRNAFVFTRNIYHELLKKKPFTKVVTEGTFTLDLLEKSVLTCFLVGGKKYEFTLIGWVHGGEKGEAKREVTVNEPPKKHATQGKCTAKPLEGKPLEPDFTLSCTEFKDDDEPLQYEFFYSKGEGSKNETLGSGLENSRSRVRFPSGVQKNGYNLTLYAKISDSLGASEMFQFDSPIKVIQGWR